MISVIVPVYNAEPYLRRCVDSVLRQTYADFELLLVDDGSTDKSGEICSAYAEKDARVRYFRKPNEGPGPTRLYGVQQSRGEYMFFLDSDDYLSDDAFETLLGAFSETVDVVIGQHKRFAERGEPKQVVFPEGVLDFQKDDKQGLFDLILRRGHHGGLELWNKLFRGSVVKSACTLPIDLMFGEDVLYTLSIFLRCRQAVFIGETTYYYEYKDNSLARNTAARMELPRFAAELTRLEDEICKEPIDHMLYPIVVYQIIKIALSRYALPGEGLERLTEDVGKIHSTKITECARRYLKNRKYFRKRFGRHKGDEALATCIFKMIRTGDVWYYTKLYPAMIEPQKQRRYIIKAYVKRFLRK